MELDEFAALFRLVLSQYEVGAIPVSLDRVTAGETTRQTGHQVKALILLGADDGSIPQAGSPPGLLSDDDRSLLALYGLELSGSARELLYREMTTVYLTCTRPSRYLLVSWAACGPGGEERRPSFLAQRLLRIFSDLTVSREERDGQFALEAPRPALEQAGWNPRARRALDGLPEYAGALERQDRAEHWGPGHPVPLRRRPALWPPGGHVRLPHGQIPLLPLRLFHALWVKGRATAAGGLLRPGLRHLCPLCAGAGHAGRDVPADPAPRHGAGL